MILKIIRSKRQVLAKFLVLDNPPRLIYSRWATISGFLNARSHDYNDNLAISSREGISVIANLDAARTALQKLTTQ